MLCFIDIKKWKNNRYKKHCYEIWGKIALVNIVLQKML